MTSDRSAMPCPNRSYQQTKLRSGSGQKSLKSRSFVKRFEVLGEFVVERAEIFPAARGELGWQFVARHDLAVLVFLHPFARFYLFAHGFTG